MSVDKNLFMYELAVVAIMKNEGPYIKEWLDYHLLAGVNHFFIYDNESPDNQKEVLQPYIERGLVTYIFFPGKSPQFPAYNDAIKRFRFFCRYMAFIDGDEFIFPQENKSITETVDEILADKPQAGALAINWHMFGSNFQRKADFSRGVLERFTRRADDNKYSEPGNLNFFIKDVVIPLHTDYFDGPHQMHHFEGYFSVNEDGNPVFIWTNEPPTTKKLVINHYNTKSLEEFLAKRNRGYAASAENIEQLVNEKKFYDIDKVSNEIFDDGILKYREARINLLDNTAGGGGYKYFGNFFRKERNRLQQNF